MPENIASRALLNRCGFKREGYARKLFEINSIWEDHVLFAVVAEDYIKNNPS
jgi:ribosomal-protein-alanine N-acetyltransferase